MAADKADYKARRKTMFYAQNGARAAPFYRGIERLYAGVMPKGGAGHIAKQNERTMSLG